MCGLFARDRFGITHHKYSDALLDYGFYLLNIDSICQSVKVYQNALSVRISIFGGNNLHVAVAHEDLAYCSYVHEYSSGKFQEARLVLIFQKLALQYLLTASSAMDSVIYSEFLHCCSIVYFI